jgi:hypothetical protein
MHRETRSVLPSLLPIPLVLHTGADGGANESALQRLLVTDRSSDGGTDQRASPLAEVMRTTPLSGVAPNSSPAVMMRPRQCRFGRQQESQAQNRRLNSFRYHMSCPPKSYL